MYKKDLVFALALITAPAWGLAPTIELPTDSRGEIAISETSQGATVALIGASRRWNGHGSTLSLVSEALSDDDRDGSVALSPHGGVSEQSLWITVDVATGAVSTASPEGAVTHAFDLTDSELRRGPFDELSRIRLTGRQANVLLVRPGQGAWRRMVGDRSLYDEDDIGDGAFTLALDQMVPFVGNEPPPSLLEDDDVLVILDPHRLAFAVTTAGSDEWTREGEER